MRAGLATALFSCKSPRTRSGSDAAPCAKFLYIEGAGFMKQ